GSRQPGSPPKMFGLDWIIPPGVLTSSPPKMFGREDARDPPGNFVSTPPKTLGSEHRSATCPRELDLHVGGHRRRPPSLWAQVSGAPPRAQIRRRVPARCVPRPSALPSPRQPDGYPAPSGRRRATPKLVGRVRSAFARG